MKQRDPLPDLLKGVAVLLMIQVHITELFSTSEFLASLPGRISLFLGGFPAAPVFMVVMGWFAYSVNDLRRITLRAGRLLILGLLLNALLNASLFARVWMGELQVDKLSSLFGADILFLAAFSLLFGGIFRGLARGRWWLLLLASAGVAAVTPLLSSTVPVDGVWRYVRPFVADGYAWWSYFPIFPWMSYGLAGMAAAALSHQNRRVWLIMNHRISRGVVFILFVGGSWVGWQVSTQLDAYYHHHLAFYLWALAAIASWIFIWQKILRIFPEFTALQWVGRKVTAIYVVQWVLVGNLGTWLYRTQSGSALVIWFMLIVLVSFSIVYGYEKWQRNDDELI